VNAFFFMIAPCPAWFGKEGWPLFLDDRAAMPILYNNQHFFFGRATLYSHDIYLRTNKKKVKKLNKIALMYIKRTWK